MNPQSVWYKLVLAFKKISCEQIASMKWLSYAVVVGVLVELVMSSPDYNQHAYDTKGRTVVTPDSIFGSIMIFILFIHRIKIFHHQRSELWK